MHQWHLSAHSVSANRTPTHLMNLHGSIQVRRFTLNRGWKLTEEGGWRIFWLKPHCLHPSWAISELAVRKQDGEDLTLDSAKTAD